MRAALIVLAILAAGCLEGPHVPARLADEPSTTMPVANTSDEPPAEPIDPTPTPTVMAQNSSPVGEWINGTLMDARLVSVEELPPYEGSTANRTQYTWEFRYHTGGQKLILEFAPFWSGMSTTLYDMNETWTFVLGPARGGFPLNVYVPVDPENFDAGMRPVPDSEIYRWGEWHP